MKKRVLRTVLCLLLAVGCFLLGFWARGAYEGRAFPVWAGISREEVFAEKDGVALRVTSVIPGGRDENREEFFQVAVERDEPSVQIASRANFTVVYAPREEGPWHTVYLTHYAQRMVSQSAPGPVSFTYAVPGAVFARKKGCYRIGMDDGLYADLPNPYA